MTVLSFKVLCAGNLDKDQINISHCTMFDRIGNAGVWGGIISLDSIHCSFFFTFSLALFFLYSHSWFSSRLALLSVLSPEGFLLKVFTLLITFFLLCPSKFSGIPVTKDK